jgi:hypothetical protein
MKTLWTLYAGIFFSLTNSCHAQSFRLDFEDTAVIRQVYYTDNLIDPQHIWQIGVPHKIIFDSSYSPTHAAVTLTDSALKPNTHAALIIKLPNTNAAYDYEGAIIVFQHKYDFDSTHGGGYVKFSADTGGHWHPVFIGGTIGGYWGSQLCLTSSNYQNFDGQTIYPPTWWGYTPMDTTAQGIPCFTGRHSQWISDTIVVPQFVQWKTDQYTNLWLRFTAYTDSNSVSTEGWMIDDISYQLHYMNCVLGVNDISASKLQIYPNPVNDAFTVSFVNTTNHDTEISLLDLMERTILYKETSEHMITIPRGDIAVGSYILRVKDKASGIRMEKRITFE